MYKFVSTISVFIRSFMFPNPFTKYFELCLSNTTYSGLTVIFADAFNFAVGGAILCLICRPLVGIIYESRSCPAWGSILYGVFVLINSKILIWISNGLNEANIKLLLIQYGLALIIEVIILKRIRYLKEYIRSY